MKDIQLASNKRLYSLITILVILIVLWQCLPYYQGIKEKREQIEQLEFFITTYDNSSHTLSNEEGRQSVLEQQLLYLQGFTYANLDEPSVGAKLVETLQAYAVESGFELASAFLLPAVKGETYTTLSADVRGTGTTKSLLTFTEYLANTNPVKIIEGARITALPTKQLQVELRISTLVFENSMVSTELAMPVTTKTHNNRYTFNSDFSLFGTNEMAEVVPVRQKTEYISNWQIKGVLYSPQKATAIVYQTGGDEQIVQVGDLLGEEMVVSITSQQIVLQHDNAYATLVVKP